MASQGDSKIPGAAGIGRDKRRSLLPAPKSHSKGPHQSVSPSEPAPGIQINTNPDVVDTAAKTSCFQTGERVIIGGVKYGVLRYFGQTHFAKGDMCGIELDEAEGSHDGTYKGVCYFTCPQNCGIFAPKEKVELLIPTEGVTENPVKETNENQKETGSRLKQPKTLQSHSTSRSPKLAPKFSMAESCPNQTTDGSKFQSKIIQPKAGSRHQVVNSADGTASTSVLANQEEEQRAIKKPSKLPVQGKFGLAKKNGGDIIPVSGKDRLSKLPRQSSIPKPGQKKEDLCAHATTNKQALDATFSLDADDEIYSGDFDDDLPKVTTPSRVDAHTALTLAYDLEASGSDTENRRQLNLTFDMERTADQQTGSLQSPIPDLLTPSAFHAKPEPEDFGENIMCGTENSTDIMTSSIISHASSLGILADNELCNDDLLADELQAGMGSREELGDSKDATELMEKDLDQELSLMSLAEVDLTSSTISSKGTASPEPETPRPEMNVTFDLGEATVLECQGMLDETDAGEKMATPETSGSICQDNSSPEYAAVPEHGEDKIDDSMSLSCTITGETDVTTSLNSGSDQFDTSQLGSSSEVTRTAVEQQAEPVKAVEQEHMDDIAKEARQVACTLAKQTAVDTVQSEPAGSEPQSWIEPNSEDSAHSREQLVSDLQAGHAKQDRPVSMISTCSEDTGLGMDLPPTPIQKDAPHLDASLSSMDGQDTNIVYLSSSKERPVSLISTCSTDTGYQADTDAELPSDRAQSPFFEEGQIDVTSSTEAGSSEETSQSSALIQGNVEEISCKTVVTQLHSAEVELDRTFDLEPLPTPSPLLEPEPIAGETNGSGGESSQESSDDSTITDPGVESPEALAGAAELLDSDSRPQEVLETVDEEQEPAEDAPKSPSAKEQNESRVGSGETSSEAEVQFKDSAPGDLNPREREEEESAADSVKTDDATCVEEEPVRRLSMPDQADAGESSSAKRVKNDMSGFVVVRDGAWTTPEDVLLRMNSKDNPDSLIEAGVILSEMSESTSKDAGPGEKHLMVTSVMVSAEMSESTCKDAGPGEKHLGNSDDSVSGTVDKNGVAESSGQKCASIKKGTNKKQQNKVENVEEDKSSPRTKLNSRPAKSPLKKGEAGSKTDTIRKPNVKVVSRVADYIKSPPSVKTKDENAKNDINNAKVSKNATNKKKADMSHPTHAVDKKILIGSKSNRYVSQRRASAPVAPVIPKLDLNSSSRGIKSTISEKDDDLPKKPFKRTPVKSKWDNIMSKIEAGKGKEKPKPKTEVKSKLNLPAVTTKQSPNESTSTKSSDLSRRSSMPVVSDTTRMRSKVSSVRPFSQTGSSRLTPEPGRPSSSASETSGRDNSRNSSGSRGSSRTASTPKPGNRAMSSLRRERSPSAGSDSQISTSSQVSSQGSKSTTQGRANQANPEKVSRVSARHGSLRDTAKPKLEKDTETRRASVATAGRVAAKSTKQSSPSSSTAKNQNRSKTGKSTLSSQKQRSNQPDVVTNSIANASATQEISRLEALCESRTKELNYAKLKLRDSKLGFEAMTVLVKYLTEELGAFSCPLVVAKLHTVQQQLTEAQRHLDELTEQKASVEAEAKALQEQHEEQTASLKADHSLQLESLETSLKEHHEEEQLKVSNKHAEELDATKASHEKTINELKEEHKQVLHGKKKKVPTATLR